MANSKQGVIQCTRCRKRRAMIDKMCIECQNFLCCDCFGDPRNAVCRACMQMLQDERKSPGAGSPGRGKRHWPEMF